MTARARWMLVVTFAAGMAWVEAASVYYLRVMVDRVEPYQPDPLPIRGILGEVELVREGATLLMLAMTGMLAGRAWRARLGYAAIAFGSWDILYYVFLRIISGWPASLFDWDILFLLPLPWWGPVLAPVCIASLMIVWGTLVTQWQDRIPVTRFTRASWGVSWAGILLALGVFMADSIRARPGGPDTVRQVLPTSFNWPVFGAALLLMATPLAHTGWSAFALRLRRDRRSLSRRREAGGSRPFDTAPSRSE
ncbi:MAG: hypothetical protein A3H96_04460 [Acidobacteria bacterium RIFCSPLOWO2_02_FULL_67_36]|nr:MAG: hypothetical protein A3H96_04460 [Acidobacteria bacterium RIFCSPLOWO2_02_FULL_67_36]OFW18750.1 MAG: hypothetical protein A3G21_12415 [Acidobacteria bacterium RIFCSPLOWO2_12_FULL_66_21]